MDYASCNQNAKCKCHPVTLIAVGDVVINVGCQFIGEICCTQKDFHAERPGNVTCSFHNSPQPSERRTRLRRPSEGARRRWQSAAQKDVVLQDNTNLNSAYETATLDYIMTNTVHDSREYGCDSRALSRCAWESHVDLIIKLVSDSKKKVPKPWWVERGRAG